MNAAKYQHQKKGAHDSNHAHDGKHAEVLVYLETDKSRPALHREGSAMDLTGHHKKLNVVKGMKTHLIKDKTARTMEELAAEEDEIDDELYDRESSHHPILGSGALPGGPGAQMMKKKLIGKHPEIHHEGHHSHEHHGGRVEGGLHISRAERGQGLGGVCVEAGGAKPSHVVKCGLVLDSLCHPSLIHRTRAEHITRIQTQMRGKEILALKRGSKGKSAVTQRRSANNHLELGSVTVGMQNSLSTIGTQGSLASMRSMRQKIMAGGQGGGGRPKRNLSKGF